MDKLSPEKRSLNMSKIRGKNTGIELKVKKWLFHNGYRYRINRSDLPGKPDILFSKYKSVIFVNGCFWHQHEGCKYSTMPKTNIEYWGKKLSGNKLRDTNSIQELKELGWNVIVIWECEIESGFENKMLQIEILLKDQAYELFK